MTSPTQQAQMRFDRAHSQLMEIMATPNDQEGAIIAMGLREGLKELSLGMNQLAVGLRAAYQLLEKVQADIDAIKRAQRFGS